MNTGKVKFFNTEKGYGFITPDDGTRDVFVHHSGIDGEGFKTLDDGATVSYELSEGREGKMQATSVKAMSRPALA